MKIELKKIQYFAAGSEETSCFQAEIWVDGVKAGHASNQGHGGPTSVSPRELEERLNSYGATLPRRETSMTIGDQPFSYQPNAEHLIDDLLSDHLVERDLKRNLTGKVMFINQDDKLMETKRVGKDRVAQLLANAKWVAGLNAKTILNLVPFHAALEIYRKIPTR